MDEFQPQLQSGWENLRLQLQGVFLSQLHTRLERSIRAVWTGVPSPARQREAEVSNPLRMEESKNCSLCGIFDPTV